MKTKEKTRFNWRNCCPTFNDVMLTLTLLFLFSLAVSVYQKPTKKFEVFTAELAELADGSDEQPVA